MATVVRHAVLESEKQLLARIADGDDNAFWELWSRYDSYVQRICVHRMHGNIQDAEDARSEVMLKAYRKVHAYANNIDSFGGWLIRLASNHCTDLHRCQARARRRYISIEGEGLPESATTPPTDENPGFTGPPAIPQLSFEELTPALREVFIDRFIEGKSHSEIAKRLNISAACVRKRVQRARAIVRKKIVCRHATEK
jgi:RNA polymerase sigma-70 factor (ECF subfamily)